MIKCRLQPPTEPAPGRSRLLHRDRRFSVLAGLLAINLTSPVTAADDRIEGASPANEARERQSAFAPQVAAARIGESVRDLTFKDIRFAAHGLDDLAPKRPLTLVFINLSCPVARRSMPALNELAAGALGKQATIAVVDVGWRERVTETAAYGLELGLKVPILKDLSGAAARRLGVTRVPTAIVLDGDRRFRYRGRIDDRDRAGGARTRTGRSDLASALEEVLAGTPVSVPETAVDGCPLELTPPEVDRQRSTWSDGIGALVHRHCFDCHRAGGEAPFELASLDDVRKRRSAVLETIAEGRMPPWHAAPDRHGFTNDRTIPPVEREAMLAWLDRGTPAGDLAAAPKPPSVTPATWRIGKPDLILTAPIEHRLPASGLVEYHYLVFPTVFFADTWLDGIEILPDNPAVVHHANLAWINLGGKYSGENFITGRVPGGVPMTLKDGVAYKLPAGSLLALQIHYVTTGKPERCRLQVGLRYARERVRKQLHVTILNNNRFAIPPGEPAHRISSTRTLPADSILVGAFSHMHLRGRDMSFEAILPDGRRDRLLTIPNYSYDWQAAYRWDKGDRRVPAGTKIECVAHFDNSTLNPFNPDPSATVRYGDQTHEEMKFGFLFHLREDEELGLDIDPKSGRVRQR
jgi:mono/diheme cytochrome c family protein